ncbi:hypothetical protein [Micrococcus luteus]|uniref:hypothetical protein n=1 Tax=Micrococcus luteus TaxID=1270 RepID=UPI003D730099
MAQIAPLGVGMIDKNDPNHQTYTAEDSEFVANTIVARLKEFGAELEELGMLLRAMAGEVGLKPQSPIDSQTAALIGLAGSLSRKAVQAAAEAATRSQFGIRAEDAGVVGDGVADDTAAFHTAARTAATAGIPLVLSAGTTIGISSYQKLPAGLVMHTNGATFKQLTPMGRAPVISLGPRSRVVGGIYVSLLGGAACQGVTIADAPDVEVDRVDVRSQVPAAGSGNVRDNGVRVLNSDRVSIGRTYVENFDWPVWAEKSKGVSLGWVEANTYAKALHLDDVTRMRVGGGHVYGASPNSKYAPGYNGVLMEGDEGTDDVRITGFTVEDAGEHGFRVSGPAAHTNIWLDACLARNSGGTGFKVLGSLVSDGVYNKGITFNACRAIDSGQFNQNTCGFLIQMADGVTLISPVVEKDKKTFSAVEGIRMSGVRHVTISNPKIMDTHKFALHIDEACGNVQDISISKMHIQTGSGHGIYLQNPGVEFRDLQIEAFVEVYAGEGAAFYAGRYTSEDTGTWRGVNELDITFSESTGAARQISTYSSENALASFTANIVGRDDTTSPGSWPPFRPGSTRYNLRLGTFQVKRADAWHSL